MRAAMSVWAGGVGMAVEGCLREVSSCCLALLGCQQRSSLFIQILLQKTGFELPLLLPLLLLGTNLIAFFTPFISEQQI